MSIPDSLGEFSFVCCSCLASPSAKVTVCQECFIFLFYLCCSVILRRNKQFKSLTWLAGSGVSIFCCKKFVNWAFELWLGGLLQAEWRIKIDEPYWQTWYILVLFHGIPYGFFFWTFAGYVYCERPEPTLSWYFWQFSMKLPQGKK